MAKFKRHSEDLKQQKKNINIFMSDPTHSGHKSPACGFLIPYEEEVGRERGKRSARGCAVEEAA